jgi:hypothetical protein
MDAIMGTLRTTSINHPDGTLILPTIELTKRVIQQYIFNYTAGEWNPDNSYTWAPGSYVDFTPRRTDSRISYIWRVPHAWSNASHVISHWQFYVNNILYYRHSQSGVHIEDGNVMKYDVPSWGTSQGRIGYQIRSYANDNHECRLYTTYYWNGTGRAAQNCYGQLIIEEYENTDQPASWKPGGIQDPEPVFDFTSTVLNEVLNPTATLSYWTPSTTYTMTNFAGFGQGTGHGYTPTTNYILTVPNLPTHSQIRYKFYWHCVDSLDGETNYLNVDGVRYLTFTKVYNNTGSISLNLCESVTFVLNQQYSYSPWGGNGQQNGYFIVDTGWINHTAASAVFTHYFGADTAQTDEAMYITHANVQIRG